MATKKYKPTTPARRHMSVPDFAEITKKTPERSLIEIKKKHAGRNMPPERRTVARPAEKRNVVRKIGENR